MKKWSFRAALAAFAASLCITWPIWAKAKDYDPYDPCNAWGPCSFGDLEIGGEFLWWKPCIDKLEFAFAEEGVKALKDEGANPLAGEDAKPSKDEIVLSRYRTKSTIKTLCPDWEPGGRVWVYKPSVLCSNCGLGASWTGIFVNHADSIGVVRDLDEKEKKIASLGIPTIQLPLAAYYDGKYIGATALFKVGYHDYDVLFSYPCFCSERSVIRPFFGFAGLILNQKLRIKGKNPSVCDGDVKWKSDLSAYGLRVGTEYECKFANCFGIFGRFAATIVTGCPDTKSRHRFDCHIKNEADEHHTILDDECYRCYPGYHLTAGVSYETCVNDVDVIFRAGYEFVEWHNLPHPRKFSAQEARFSFFKSASPVITHTNASDRTFGWQGILVGLGVYF
ncbi:MAG: Lpg1974 family pore-forming outer membrane protein [Waddliaceae bacterium]